MSFHPFPIPPPNSRHSLISWHIHNDNYTLQLLCVNLPVSPIRVVLLNGTSIYFSLNPSTQKAFKKTFSLPKAFLKLKKDSDSICKTLIKNYEMINITFFFKRENCGEKKKSLKLWPTLPTLRLLFLECTISESTCTHTRTWILLIQGWFDVYFIFLNRSDIQLPVFKYTLIDGEDEWSRKVLTLVICGIKFTWKMREQTKNYE